jgi:Na+-driven multidrug efflux pump
MRESLTVKETLKFFLPLMFVIELLSISHSVIQAFLARLPSPQVVLASYNAAFSVCSTLGSPSSVTTGVAIAFVSDKRSFWRVINYVMLLLAAPMVALVLIGLTPIGDWIYGTLMGASAEAIVQAKAATRWMILYPPSVVVRFMATALIMVNRRTILTTIGSAVRLASLWVSLSALPLVLSGAAVGGLALTTCMWVEMTFTMLLALPFYRALPEGSAEDAGYLRLWRYSWPLLINQVAENGIQFCVNIFLGRLAKPDLALAAFGVISALVRMLLSPVRNLMETALTLVKSPEDQAMMLRFTLGVIVVFATLFELLFYTPLRHWVLQGVMGLKPDLAAYALPGTYIALLVLVSWAYSAVFRGLLAAQKRTGAIAVSALARIAMIGLVGSVAYALPDLNGSVLGILALAAAFGAEAYLLGYRLFVARGRPSSIDLGMQNPRSSERQP